MVKIAHRQGKAPPEQAVLAPLQKYNFALSERVASNKGSPKWRGAALLLLYSTSRILAEMAEFKFRVSWNNASANWIVRLGDEHYGAYLTKEQALLDAVDAAGEARTNGDDAHVWDATKAARIF